MHKMTPHIKKSVVRPKLVVNAPGDRFEQEADAMAESVMRMQAPGQTGTDWQGPKAQVSSSRSPYSGSPIAGSVQRKCAECDEEEKKKGKVMRKADGGSSFVGNGGGFEASPELSSQLDRGRGGGRPLVAETKNFMEHAFSTDFSGVRVHTDGEAGDMSRKIGAKAFTYGNDVYFNGGHYTPESVSGQRLLAHELTHVVQQRGGAGTIQRAPLVTPLPAIPAPAKPSLTAAQVQEAILFNKARYDLKNTKLIQDLLGQPSTGTWTAADIGIIADTQQKYGLKKDGKVGHELFQFIDKEQTAEGKPTDTDNCLVSFRLIGPNTQNFGRDDATHCHFFNSFAIEAEFSDRCNCSEFQYRQYIAGALKRTRGGVVSDVAMTSEPGGVIPPKFRQDADTTDVVAPHYGHRIGEKSEVPSLTKPENRYLDAKGHTDRLKGCRYRMTDSPGAGVASLGDCLPGDRYDLLMKFKGSIFRLEKPIQEKTWTAINIPNWHP
jgi:hypothetical protein